MNILEKIILQKEIEISDAKKKLPLKKLEGKIKTKNRGSFIKAFNNDKMAFICEVKKASPSKGIIRRDFDHLEIADIYAKTGASAISVLTDQEFFKGHLSYLDDIAKVTDIPLIRKDFIIDEYQIAEALAAGASAVLLIAAALDDTKLIRLFRYAKDIGLDVLLEVHNEPELNRALKTDAKIIGINNRDLTTFKTDIATTKSLIKKVPDGKIVVSESGINTKEDIRTLFEHSVRGVLIGEALCREKDIGAKLKELMSFSAIN